MERDQKKAHAAARHDALHEEPPRGVDHAPIQQQCLERGGAIQLHALIACGCAAMAARTASMPPAATTACAPASEKLASFPSTCPPVVCGRSMSKD